MKTKDRLDQHDRQIAAIRDLVKQGMRLVIETRKDFRTLAAMQKATAANLNQLIESMKGGGNGHAKRKVNLS